MGEFADRGVATPPRRISNVRLARGRQRIEWELHYDAFSGRPLLVRTVLVARLCATQAQHIRFLPSDPFAAAVDRGRDVRADHQILHSSSMRGRPTSVAP